MSHTKWMEVVQSSCQLVGKSFGSLFTKLERSFLKVSEQVSTLQHFHDDVNLVLVLEDIEQTNDIWMLTHLQNLNFSFLKFNILHSHFLLGHYFYCHCFSSLLVSSWLNQTKFTLADGLFELIKVLKICVTNNLFDDVHPSFLVLLIKQVVSPWFVAREN